MRSPPTGLNDDSATISDGSTTETDIDSETETETDEKFPSPYVPCAAFEEGEKVLAFHNEQTYEAKVTKVRLDPRKEWQYRVHYVGWKKSWDEWVGVDRLMKYSEERAQKHRALNRKQDLEKVTKAGCAQQIRPQNSSVVRGRKRKNDSLSKEKGSRPLEKLVNLQIPPTLKKKLVDDYEFITHLGKLVKLPRTPNVEDIFKMYLQYRLKKDVIISEPVEEIMQGLRCYFDKALGVMLLYKSERVQYTEAVRDDVSPSMVYGAEHLLRLFVKLPELLAYANIDEETLTELQQILVNFLKFLQKNQSAFFLSTYHVPEDTETSTNNQDD